MNEVVSGDSPGQNSAPDQASGHVAFQTSGTRQRRRDRTRLNFIAFLVLGFFLSSGLALSIAYVSFSGIAGSGRLGGADAHPLSASDTSSIMMTYIGVSILLAQLAAFILIYAIGRHMVLSPQLELRRSRERLRSSEIHARRLAQVAEKASDLVIIYDRDGKITWVNAAFIKTTGFLSDEVIGKRPGEFLNGDKSDPTTGRRIEDAMRRGEPVTAQIINYSKSGREYLVELNISPVRDEDGELTSFVAVERDVSERHMAERRLRDAVEIMEDGFTIYDRDNRLVLFNAAYEKSLGLSGALRRGMPLAEIGALLEQGEGIDLGDQTPEDWAEEHVKTMRSGVAERLYTRHDGHVLLIRDRVTDHGEVVSLHTDVTELHQARHKAEEAGEAKSRFFASITHEVRTPLNGVIAMAELLLESDLTEPQRSGLQLISQSGSSLLTIINDILDYSKIEMGKMTVQPAPFDVTEAIEDIVALLAPEAQKRNNELAFQFDPALPRLILGDHGRVRQIATNLIGNAIKFTSGGEIVVRLNGELAGDHLNLVLEVDDSGVGIPEDRLNLIFQPFEQVDGPMRQEGAGLGLSICRLLATLMDGDLSATSVIDQGSTFQFSAAFPHLESGAAVPAVLNGVAPVAIHGSGPHAEGLASQIRVLGGQIADDGTSPGLNIISVPREGAFPADVCRAAMAPSIIIAPQDMASPTEPSSGFSHSVRVLRRPVRTGILASNITKLLGTTAPGHRPSVERRRKIRAADLPLVLVAEDNATNAAIIRAMLADQEMRVEIYPDGASAVEAYERHPPSVVLMDIQLPDMTGHEATQRIRALEGMEQRPEIPIIAATASSRPEDQKACLEAGMDDFISKPLSKQQLCAKLTYWISTSAAARSDVAHRIAG